MGFVITSSDYCAYIRIAAEKIHENGEYVTALDAKTGDGDHWININMGFEELVKQIDTLQTLPFDQMLKKIGMLLMSKIGGSSGILYGGAYIAAGKALRGKEAIGPEELYTMLHEMVQDMMQRGKAQPGFKTMIDALYPAAKTCRECLDEGADDKTLLARVRQAALDGAESTKNMEAVKGRASYQANKGIGDLDPGAVTMAYQLECLCDYIASKLP